MKRLIHSLLLATICSHASAASLVGLWEFNDSSNIGRATVGSNLTIVGATPIFSATGTDDYGKTLSGTITTIAGSGNSLRATHGMAGNGGGSFVNEYSIVVDMFSPAGSRDSWRTIFQTNVSNSNDGDLFIRNNTNTMGTADLGYSATFAEDRWVRLVVSVDNGSFFRTYIDGVLLTNHTTQAVDGRYSLDPSVLFFADNDTDNAPLQIGAVALYNGALTASEISALGTAGSAIPEPSGLLLGGLSGGMLLMSRRRASSPRN